MNGTPGKWPLAVAPILNAGATQYRNAGDDHWPLVADDGAPLLFSRSTQAPKSTLGDHINHTARYAPYDFDLSSKDGFRGVTDNIDTGAETVDVKDTNDYVPVYQHVVLWSPAIDQAGKPTNGTTIEVETTNTFDDSVTKFNGGNHRWGVVGPGVVFFDLEETGSGIAQWSSGTRVQAWLENESVSSPTPPAEPTDEKALIMWNTKFSQNNFSQTVIGSAGTVSSNATLKLRVIQAAPMTVEFYADDVLLIKVEGVSLGLPLYYFVGVGMFRGLLGLSNANRENTVTGVSVTIN